jgi:HAD superfamily hydrolase (TIGR01509 family)
VIFDLDGTVVENSYDWPLIKRTLGSGDTPILEYLYGLKGPERERKLAVLEKFEAEQTAQAVLRPGMSEVITVLRTKGVRTALVTNNSLKNTEALVDRFGLRFDLILTRESGLWKPSGEAFRRVMREFGAGPEECAVVGDTKYDLAAAAEAGVASVFIMSEDAAGFDGSSAVVCRSAEELLQKIEALLE